MPRTAKITPIRTKWSGERQWKVEIPATLNQEGKRRRLFFPTKQEAQTFCEQLRIRRSNRETAGMTELSVVQLAQAAEAFEKLDPYGVTLTAVVAEWIARLKASSASKTFESCMDDFIAWGKRSPSYINSIRQTRNRLSALHGKLLNSITPADLTRALDTMTPSVRNFTIRILGGLFNYAIKRDYCVDNPCKKLDLSQLEAVEIQIYTPSQVAAIFTAVEANAPELIPYFAVSFFCGIRRSEMLRLDWSHIDLIENFVKLPAAITKTKQGRHIEISENCAAWLKPQAKSAGRVTPLTSEVVRNKSAELNSALKIDTIKHGARHCFASYWLAKHGEIDTLCRALGHDDPETTFKHYAKAATKRDAERFWSIKPSDARMENVVDFQNRKKA
jgi:integrase